MGVLWKCTILTALLGLAHAVTLHTVPSKPPADVFDFVIVGGGTAGNAIAARLTEDPNCSVLVIEAGINNTGVLGVDIPFLAPANLPNSSVTWNYSTIPQAALNNRILTYPRGRVLGGSSSINFFTYTRGADEEYDRWANITGDEGWAWKNVAPFYFKSSKLVPSQQGNLTGNFDPKFHGNGPVEVSLPDFPTELDDRVRNTAMTTPEFPFNIDFQSGNPIGVSALPQFAIGNGVRSSSATAYLDPALHRPNLHVITERTVTRLIQTGTSHGTPEFTVVEFAASQNGPRQNVTARREIILAAGAVNTPQVLMLSGIGDTSELVQMGIKPRVHSPDVGKHLQDHPIMSNYWLVNSTNTFDDVIREPSILNADLAQWMANHTGLFANGPANAVAFLRIPDNSTIFENFTDPAPGNTPHFEMIWADGFAQTVLTQPAEGHFMTINTAVVAPLSTGSVRLASTDPFTFPLIDPNFFASPFDQAVMVESVLAVRRFVDTQPWADFILGRFGPVGLSNTTDDIIAASRDAIVSIWHPTSTARMSPKNASWGVVDNELRLKGASGVRVVDASIFPVIPAGHPAAFLYIVAEMAADLIKKEWGLKR